MTATLHKSSLFSTKETISKIRKIQISAFPTVPCIVTRPLDALILGKTLRYGSTDFNFWPHRDSSRTKTSLLAASYILSL